MGVFDVRFSAAADEDLGALLGFLLDRAKTVEDRHEAELAISAISAISAIRTAVFSHLAHTPYSFRKAGRSSTRRELIIPFGTTGYVALFEIMCWCWRYDTSGMPITTERLGQR